MCIVAFGLFRVCLSLNGKQANTVYVAPFLVGVVVLIMMTHALSSPNVFVFRCNGYLCRRILLNWRFWCGFAWSGGDWMEPVADPHGSWGAGCTGSPRHVGVICNIIISVYCWYSIPSSMYDMLEKGQRDFWNSQESVFVARLSSNTSLTWCFVVESRKVRLSLHHSHYSVRTCTKQTNLWWLWILSFKTWSHDCCTSLCRCPAFVHTLHTTYHTKCMT